MFAGGSGGEPAGVATGAEGVSPGGKGSCWLGLLIEFFLNIHQLEDWPPNSGTIDMHGVL